MVAEIVTSTRAVHDGRIRIVGVRVRGCVGAWVGCVRAWLTRGRGVFCTWKGRTVAEFPSR
jgi:hypothetical protein